MALRKVKKITPVSSKKSEEPLREEQQTSKVTVLPKKFTPQSVEKMAEEYEAISKQITLLQDTKKTLADNIKKASEELGTKDDKGSLYLDCGEYIVGRVSKKSVSLNEEKAISFIKKSKKSLISRVIDMVEKINEKALKNEVIGGTITKEEFQSLTDVKVTYAVSVTKKEEMPDVEVSTLAASKKNN